MNTTDVTEAMKYTYFNSPDRLAYLASEEVSLWNVLKRKKMDLGGRGQAILPIRTRNAGVFKGISEAGTLTTRRSQPDTQEATFALQEFEFVIDVSWKVLQDMRSSKFAFENGFNLIDNALRVRMFRLINADVLGYGRGELGILPAADDQVEITVRQMPLVDIGMIVDLMDDSDDNAIVGADGAAVTDVDVLNNTITTGTAGSSTAAGDYFTVADSVSSGGSLHMAGILAWISASNPKTVVGNLGGINRSTAGNGFWRSTVLSASANRPLTEDLLLQGFDAVRRKGGKRVNRLFSNDRLARRYHELLKEDVFFALSSVKGLESGVGVGRDEEGMSQGADSDGKTIYRFSGVPWHIDTFFDANRLIGFNDEHFWIGTGENEMPDVLSNVFDGQVPFYTQTDSAKFDIKGYWQAELISDNPPASFLISEIAES